MAEKLARLAGLGAFGACAGLLALYLFLIYLTRPMGQGGMDGTSAAVSWIALGGLFAALIIMHVVIGRRLLRLSRGVSARHPL